MNVGKSGCCCLSSFPHSPPSVFLPPLLSPPVGLQLSVSQQRSGPSPFTIGEVPFWILIGAGLNYRPAHMLKRERGREGEGVGVCKVPRGGWFKRQVALFSISTMTSVVTSKKRIYLLFLLRGSYRAVGVCLCSGRLSKAGGRNQTQR